LAAATTSSLSIRPSARALQTARIAPIWFHSIVGHLLGAGLDAAAIEKKLRQHPEGIGARYIAEDRLDREIARSAAKYESNALPAFVDLIEISPKPPKPAPPKTLRTPTPSLNEDDDLEDPPELSESDPAPSSEDDLSGLRFAWDRRPDLASAWLIKHLLPEIGVGLVSGQNSTGKTFIAFDLLAALATSRPFLGHTVKKPSGTLLIAAEGASEVDLRLSAVQRERCDGLDPMPFSVWDEDLVPLLGKDAVRRIVAKAKAADREIRRQCGLPLGLIIVDTLGAAAGFKNSGDGNDAAVGQAVMNVLRAVAQATITFVLAADHIGKTIEDGTRGSVSKEDSADVVWYVLGDKPLTGGVVNSQLAIRKHRGGLAGEVYPFEMHLVQEPAPDKDGDPITSKIIEWTQQRTPGAKFTEPIDPWLDGVRVDQRAAIRRLKQAIMEVMAEHGVELPIPPDGPVVRIVDEEIVKKLFFTRTRTIGSTPKQKRQSRSTQYDRALNRAEGEQQVVAAAVIDEVTYLRLTHPPRDEEEGEDEGDA
jgi:AAA domain